MTRLFDGNRLIGITVQTWTGTEYTPDWSNDLFEIGNLPYDADHDAYIVEDVAYCIDFATDWEAEDIDNVCFAEEYDPETGAFLPALEEIEALPTV